MYLLNALAACTNNDARIKVIMQAEYPDNITLLLPNDYTISIGYGRGHYGSGRFSVNPEPTIANVTSVELLVTNHFGDIIPADSEHDAHGWFPCKNIPGFVAELSSR